MVGIKNKGLLAGLLRLIYEEIGNFDNYAVSITKINFQVDVYTPDSSMSKFSITSAEQFEDFGDFIQYFDQQISKRLYNDMVVVKLSFEVSSKHDPLYSSRRDLVFAVLPFIAETKVIKPNRSPSSQNS